MHELSYFVDVLFDVFVLFADSFPLSLAAFFDHHANTVHVGYWIHLLDF